MYKGGLIFLVCALVMTGCQSKEQVNEQQVLNDFYRLVSSVNELFGHFSISDEHYVNGQYQTIEDVAELLGEWVTDDGLETIISQIFEEDEGKLIYKERYREYIEESNILTMSPNNTRNYYEVVRETILNPGLQLVPFSQLLIVEDNDEVILAGSQLPVVFYEEEIYQRQEQYLRYGYPPNDVLSVTFSFKEEDGIFKMDNYEVSKG
ncbi:hypothetical protein [Bacillus sp. FJAT-45350]|uniref:hypothetical protein n=1 Tax=Bacillus sp. FJAT-45350 TaxID=2011014 RepID=UPI000BB88133|nr:hypothetical protein [Bacillus sp. FJAT-45350]